MMVTKLNRSLRNAPPSEACLLQHSKRAVVQAVYVWSQWCNVSPNIPDPASSGWQREDSGYVPLWPLFSEASKYCKKLVKCGFKALCTHVCKCKQLALPCTSLCVCDGQCNQEDML